jgi:hypothetical protein
MTAIKLYRGLGLSRARMHLGELQGEVGRGLRAVGDREIFNGFLSLVAAFIYTTAPFARGRVALVRLDGARVSLKSLLGLPRPFERDPEQGEGERAALVLFDCRAQMLDGASRMIGLDERACKVDSNACQLRVYLYRAGELALGIPGLSLIEQGLTETPVRAGESGLKLKYLPKILFGIRRASERGERDPALVVCLVERGLAVYSGRIKLDRRLKVPALLGILTVLEGRSSALPVLSRSREARRQYDDG